MTAGPMPEASTRRSLRGPVVWGVAVGCLQAASPLASSGWIPRPCTRSGSP